MWNEPYLESCCRAALHRLVQAEADGRPAGLKDGGCLERLTGMGFAGPRADGRFAVTDTGRARHRIEVLRLNAAA